MRSFHFRNEFDACRKLLSERSPANGSLVVTAAACMRIGEGVIQQIDKDSNPTIHSKAVRTPGHRVDTMKVEFRLDQLIALMGMWRCLIQRRFASPCHFDTCRIPDERCV
jgi:hypothetical protein